MFYTYFELGWHHLLDPNAYDHLLFLLALSCLYVFADWRALLILVTAFTIGHTITLGLAAANIIRANARWIEFLIPCTIAATAISNLFIRKYNFKGFNARYWLALAFGLIHGLGFANYLRSLLGRSESLLVPLLGFNVGLEVAQIVVVLIIVALGQLLQRLATMNRREWVMFISGGCLFAALLLMRNTWPA